MHLAMNAKMLSGWPVRVAVVDLGRQKTCYQTSITIDGAFPTLDPFQGRSRLAIAPAALEVLVDCLGEYRLVSDLAFMKSMEIEPSTVIA